MGDVKIVGLMRFSVVLHNAYKKYWRVTRHASEDAITRSILNPKRLDARLRLAEHMPIASLARQVDKDFELRVLHSTLLPEPHLARLSALAERHAFLRLAPVAPDADFLKACSDLIPRASPCVTFRLDDDDAVGPHFIGDLRGLARPENLERVVSFVNGLQMERRGRSLAFEEVDYPKLAIGLSLFSAEGKTIFDSGGHGRIAEDRLILHDRPQAWIRSIHAASDSASRFKGSSTWTTAPAEAARRLPQYGGIDFAAVARDLAPFDWRHALRRLVRRQAQRVRARVSRRRV